MHKILVLVHKTRQPPLQGQCDSFALHLILHSNKLMQITTDLHSFWGNAYFEVRKDLKIRYPRHSWPEDPLTADAVNGAKKKIRK